MAFLYIGTFGSFIGYSAAMPLLIKIDFYVPSPPPAGIGINFAYYAFLGALVGSITRPFGGWLADKYGGARVTLWHLRRDDPRDPRRARSRSRSSPRSRREVPADPSTFVYSEATRAAVDANSAIFPWFLVAFLFVFAATGIGNGSTFRMIPVIWQRQAERTTTVETRRGRPGAGDQGVLRGHRHRRRGRCDRRLPDPADLRLARGSTTRSTQ